MPTLSYNLPGDPAMPAASMGGATRSARALSGAQTRYQVIPFTSGTKRVFLTVLPVGWSA